MAKLTALRTWTSSNGARLRFIVMYQVRSPEKMCRFFLRVSSWAYFAITSLGGVSGEPSSSPRSTLSKMSCRLVLMSIVILSTLAERSSALSVAGS